MEGKNTRVLPEFYQSKDALLGKQKSTFSAAMCCCNKIVSHVSVQKIGISLRNKKEDLRVPGTN